MLYEQPTEPKILFQAGAFTEAHLSSKIIIGGEHDVSSVVSNSFGVYGRLISQFFPEGERQYVRAEAKGVTLGNCVILSANTTIVDGSNVEDGSILAAGAVVVSRCGPYSIYGGVPARKIKQRLSSEQITSYEKFDLPMIRSHCLPETPSILRALESGRMQVDVARGMVEYMNDVPRIIISGSRGGNDEMILNEIMAFSVGGQKIEDVSTIDNLKSYFDQSKANPQKFAWSPDVFHAIGLS